MSQSAEATGPHQKQPMELRFDLTPEERDLQRERRAWSINALYIPRLRLIGSFIISAWVFLHMRYISGGTTGLWAIATLVLFAHALISWAVLYRYYRLGAKFDLSIVALTIDLLIWIWLIYITGAEQSWLFIMLSVRAADQTAFTFRRTIIFAHLGAALYVGMLAFLYLNDRPLDWASAWSKAAIIYGFNVYLSLAARTTEQIRRKMAAAIKLSRTLIGDLEQKRVELSEALSKSAELERSLAQAQKLESLGQMATGIAHDFNNTMMSAMPWADLIAKKGEKDPELHHAAERIRSAIRRAKEVTSRLLGFAQPGRPEIQTADLRQIVRQELETLRLSLGEQIRLEVVETGEPHLVEIDTAQFAQVLANLTLNARDAMPGGGALTFTIRAAHPEEHGHPEVSPLTHLALDVSDTGSGMDAATAAKIFDPFFTTKPFGQGTGLGLAVVHRTIQQTGGFIYVRSTPGAGSTFTIVLPRASASRADEAVAESVNEQHDTLSGVTVLIVDDDPSVLESLEMMLDMSGASVVIRDSGRDALALLDSGFQPDAIVLDLGMPEMSGSEVHEEIRKRGIRLPVVISSGYGERERIEPLLTDGCTFYLQKPYGLAQLEAVLQQACR